MKFRRIVASALAVSLACFSSWVPAQTPVTLKFVSAFPSGTKTNSQSVPAFIKAVEEASEGTLKIQHYPGGTLGSNPAAQLKLVEDGVVDMAEVVAAYTPGRFPELELFELPFIFENTKEASLASWSMYEQGFLNGFDRVKLLGIAQVGPYFLHTKTPVNSAEDLAGKKFRAGGAVQGAVIRGIGGVAVGGLPATQIAENITRGVIDGTLLDMGNMYSFRVTDAAKYHITNAPLGNVPVLFPINKKKYDSLPQKAKDALDKYSGKWFSTVLSDNLDLQNAESLAKMQADSKHVFVELSSTDLDLFKQELRPLTEKWDRETKGVNLYQKMIQARDAARAQP